MQPAVIQSAAIIVDAIVFKEGIAIFQKHLFY